jgi:hypothetical protein
VIWWSILNDDSVEISWSTIIFKLKNPRETTEMFFYTILLMYLPEKRKFLQVQREPSASKKEMKNFPGRWRDLQLTMNMCQQFYAEKANTLQVERTFLHD